MLYDDSTLIQKTLNDNSDWFDHLIDRYWQEIYAIVYSMVKNREDAEELTQSVFMKAYQNLERLKYHRKFASWLGRIARNSCLDWLKAKKEDFLSLEKIEFGEQLLIPSVEEKLLQQEFDFTMAELFRSLPEQDKKILSLFYIHGFSHDEIRRIDESSYSAVTSRLHKAKEKVRKKMKTKAYEPARSPSIGVITKALSGGFKEMKLTVNFEILDVLKTVEYAQGTDESRKFLMGVNLDYTVEDGLKLVATDAKRMAIVPASVKSADKEAQKGVSMTIPTEEINRIKKLLTEAKDRAEDFDIERIDQDLAALHIGDEKKLIKLYSESFPNWRDVIPKDYMDSIVLRKEPVIKLLEKIKSDDIEACNFVQKDKFIYVLNPSDIYDERRRIRESVYVCKQLLDCIVENPAPEDLKMKIDELYSPKEYRELLDTLELKDATTEKSIGKLEIIDSDGEKEFWAQLKVNYLLDALKALRSKSVKIRYKKTSYTIENAILIEDGDNTHLIMPMVTFH